jgi:hypothetical protein
LHYASFVLPPGFETIITQVVSGAIGGRSEIQAKVVQAAAGCHYQVAKATFPVTKPIFNNPIAFHTANGVFHSDANSRNLAVEFLVFSGEFSATRFLFGLKNRHTFQSETLKARVLIENTALGQSQFSFVSDLLVVFLALTSVGQQDDLALSIDAPVVFDAMAFLFAAVIGFLCFLILGALNGALCTILKVDLDFIVCDKSDAVRVGMTPRSNKA